MKEQQTMMNKILAEQMEQKAKYEEIINKNNELLEKQSSLQDKLSIMQSKAYGFDAAKKFDLYKGNQQRNLNANDQYDPLRHKLKTQQDHQQGYNFWERDNKINHANRLDDLSREKDLWVNNQDKNVHKLVNDIDKSSKNNSNNVGGNFGSNNYYGSTNANANKGGIANSGNMGKYSNMILNNNPTNQGNLNKSKDYGGYSKKY